MADETSGINLPGSAYDQGGSAYGVNFLQNNSVGNTITDIASPSGATSSVENTAAASSNTINGLLGGLTGGLSSLFGSSSSASGAGAQSSFWSDLFLRSVIIVLGFIFVDAGLHLFGAPSVIGTIRGKK